MSARSSEVIKNQPDKQNIGERQSQMENSGWTVINGDLTKYLQNEESDEYIVLERILPAQQTAAGNGKTNTSSSETLDKKNTQEFIQMRAVQIILHRVETSTVALDLYGKSQAIATGKKPYALFICLGNGSRRKKNDPYFQMQSYDPCQNQPSVLDEWTQLFKFFQVETILSDNNALSFNDDRWRFKELKAKLGKVGRLAFCNYIGIVTGNMRSAMIEQALEILQKFDFLSLDDAQFLKNIVKPRKSSVEELTLEDELQKKLVKKDAKGAIEKAIALHVLSRKEALARGSLMISLYNDDVKKKLLLLDDCDAAFRVGVQLEFFAPDDAVIAFKIITAYKDNSFNEKYESLYLRKALDKIININIQMLGSVNNEVEQRRDRKSAIKAIFARFSSSDFQTQSDSFTLLLKLLEVQSGFDNYGSDRLFDKILVSIKTPKDLPDAIQNMIFTLVDKLYEYRKAGKLRLMSPDIKSQQEMNAQKVTDSKPIGSFSATSVMASTSTAATKSRLLASNSLAKSLEEDDDDSDLNGSSGLPNTIAQVSIAGTAADNNSNAVQKNLLMQFPVTAASQPSIPNGSKVNTAIAPEMIELSVRSLSEPQIKIIRERKGRIIKSDKLFIFELPMAALASKSKGGIREDLGLCRVALSNHSTTQLEQLKMQLTTKLPRIRFDNDPKNENGIIATFEIEDRKIVDEVVQQQNASNSAKMVNK